MACRDHSSAGCPIGSAVRTPCSSLSCWRASASPRCFYAPATPSLSRFRRGWGQMLGLFPATCTDLYGRKFATANYGLLYTAKGTAALLVPLANVLATATGSWTAVFVVASVLNVVAATLALLALKPLRRRAM